MIVNKKYKFIYIHVPRTGGTALRNLFSKSDLTNFKDYFPEITYMPFHITMEQAYNHYPAFKDQFDSFYKFGFVRDPYDRFLSAFFYTSRIIFKHPHTFFNEMGVKGITKHLKEIYIKKLYGEGTKFFEIIKVPQYKFLCDSNDKIIVNEVFRFENYNDNFLQLGKKLNLPLPFEWLQNNGVHQINESYKFDFDKKLILDDEIKDTIYNLYKKDFDIFNYQK